MWLYAFLEGGRKPGGKPQEEGAECYLHSLAFLLRLLIRLKVSCSTRDHKAWEMTFITVHDLLEADQFLLLAQISLLKLTQQCQVLVKSWVLWPEANVFIHNTQLHKKVYSLWHFGQEVKPTMFTNALFSKDVVWSQILSEWWLLPRPSAAETRMSRKTAISCYFTQSHDTWLDSECSSSF